MRDSVVISLIIEIDLYTHNSRDRPVWKSGEPAALYGACANELVSGLSPQEIRGCIWLYVGGGGGPPFGRFSTRVAVAGWTAGSSVRLCGSWCALFCRNGPFEKSTEPPSGEQSRSLLRVHRLHSCIMMLFKSFSAGKRERTHWTEVSVDRMRITLSFMHMVEHMSYESYANPNPAGSRLNKVVEVGAVLSYELFVAIGVTALAG